MFYLNFSHFTNNMTRRLFYFNIAIFLPECHSERKNSEGILESKHSWPNRRRSLRCRSNVDLVSLFEEKCQKSTSLSDRKVKIGVRSWKRCSKKALLFWDVSTRYARSTWQDRDESLKVVSEKLGIRITVGKLIKKIRLTIWSQAENKRILWKIAKDNLIKKSMANKP